MNHPSEEWKDLESFELSKDKKRFICRDIRFDKVEPDDLDDHQKCFLWELNRTLLYKDIKVDTEYPQDEFPFLCRIISKKSISKSPV
jgi:hypothetical protein